MDTTQMATPQEFAEKWGVTDPALAADLARQANAMSGRLGTDAQIVQSHSLDGWAPPPPAPPPAQPTAVEMSQLAQENSDASAAATIAQYSQAPASPQDYVFPHARDGASEALLGVDSALRGVFKAENISASDGKTIMFNLRDDMAALARNPNQASATLERSRSLQGADFEGNVKAVDALFDDLIGKPAFVSAFAVAARENGMSIEDFQSIVMRSIAVNATTMRTLANIYRSRATKR